MMSSIKAFLFKFRHKFVFISIFFFFAYVSIAYSETDLGDANATEGELKQFNEKYLKNKIQALPQTNEKVKEIKISDIAKYKRESNSTMNKIYDSKFIQDLNKSFKSEKVNDIDELLRSSDFRENIKRNKKLILENYEIAGEKMQEHTNSNESNRLLAANDGTEKLFIVISSSMPTEQIREYFRQLEGKENIVFVMRGLVGDATKFLPTKEYITSIVKKYPNDNNSQEVYNVAVEINPKITRRYGVEKVPAFIHVKNYTGQLEQAEPINYNSDETFQIAYGMGSIEYIVNEMNKDGKSVFLANLVKKETFFNQ